MSNLRNCMNCGAPFDVKSDRCSYCGTSFFDLTAMDLSSEKPFMLKLKLGDQIITQLVVPMQEAEIVMNCDTYFAKNPRTLDPILAYTHHSFITTLQFQSVPWETHNDIVLIQEEQR